MTELEQRAAVVAVIAAILVSSPDYAGRMYDEDEVAQEAFDLLAASARCVGRESSKEESK